MLIISINYFVNIFWTGSSSWGQVAKFVSNLLLCGVSASNYIIPREKCECKNIYWEIKYGREDNMEWRWCEKENNIGEYDIHSYTCEVRYAVPLILFLYPPLCSNDTDSLYFFADLILKMTELFRLSGHLTLTNFFQSPGNLAQVNYKDRWEEINEFEEINNGWN